jgi:hypothetical protein
MDMKKHMLIYFFEKSEVVIKWRYLLGKVGTRY